MSTVLVFGNGESRKHFKFSNQYPTIGCNAIHRDHKVDHLVCCDRRMVQEAIENPNIEDTQIYVRPSWYHYFRKILKNKNISKVPELPYTGETKKDNPDHWGSGAYAVLLAASLNFNEVKLIGFDLYSKNNFVNNIYKNTKNYSSIDSVPVDHSYWVYQISQIFTYYPNTRFTIINEPGWEIPTEWKRLNVSFENIFDNSLDYINTFSVY